MKLSGLKSLAKTVSRATSGGNFEEEFLLLLKTKMESIGRQDEMDRWEHEKNNVPYAIHPSNIGACSRCVFYNYLKYPPESVAGADDTLISIQDSGTDRHERIQSVLYKMGPQFEMLDPRVEAGRAREKGINTLIVDQQQYEGKVFGKDYFEIRCYNTNLPTWFKTDGIFRFKGIKGIFEFKTEIEQKNMRRVSPEPTHVEQAMSYAYAFDLDYILFLYEDRNLFRRKPFLIKIDKEKQAQLLEKYAYIRLHAEHNELPPKEEDKCKKSYCKHPSRCKSDEIVNEYWEQYKQSQKIPAERWARNS